MRRPRLPFAALALVASLARAQSTSLYVTPDVPTVPGGAATLVSCTGGPAMLPWEIYRHESAGGVTYRCVLSVPGSPHVDAVHKLDTPGDFLLSLREPSNLGGILLPASSTAMPGDVIHYDGSLGTYSLCFVGATVGIPPERNVDAMYRASGDTGDLIVSFDVPTNLGAFPTFEPADLVVFNPSAAAICPATWSVAAVNPAFDASSAGAGLAIASNVIGADSRLGTIVLAFDVPTTVSPPLQPIRVPGEVVSFSAGTFALLASLVGWPTSSRVDGLSSLANPGTVPATITLGKTVSPGQLDLTPININWPASCSPDGATNYGIYEGTIGTWYGHTWIDCDDVGSNLTETVGPAAGNRYYLLVPLNANVEGSYGKCSPAAGCGAANERPAGAAVCATSRVITPCPSP